MNERQLATIIAAVVLIVWSLAAVASLITENPTTLAAVMPVMMAVLGIVTLLLRRNGKNGKNGHA